MDKADLKRISVEAAMDRIVGTTTIPVRHFAELVKKASAMIDGYTAEFKQWEEFDAEQKKFLRETQRVLNEYVVELARIRQIKGEKGDDGITPTKEDLLALIRPLIPKVENGKTPTRKELLALIKPLIPTVRDGVDAIIEDEKLEELVEKLLSKHKERLDNEVASYRSQLAGKVYGKDTWARGGGDTVAAGTNVTITVDEDGNKVISAQGGTGGAQIATETVTATNAGGNNVDIDLTQLSQPWTSIEMVIRNGVIQNQNKWSIVGDVLTLTGAVSTNDFQIQYVY